MHKMDSILDESILGVERALKKHASPRKALCNPDFIKHIEKVISIARSNPQYYNYIADESLKSYVKVGYLSKTIDKFKDCLSSNPEIRATCAFDSAYVSYVDFRRMPGSKMEFFSGALDKLGYDTSSDDMIKELKYQQLFEAVMSMLPSDRANPLNKIDKQINATDKPIQDALAKFFDERVNAVNEVYKSNPHLAIIYRLVLEMDMYTLGRIFKKNKYGEYTKKIIVYAGGLHIENYQLFLAKFLEGTTTLEKHDRKESATPEFRCVTLSDNVLNVFGGQTKPK